ncbi:MAG: hypothetical protein AABY07_08715 [Nanoarchaeota archaeon]
MRSFIEKIVNGKYYLSVQDEVITTWGGTIWQYNWDCYLTTKKQLQNLMREEKKEGWIKLILVRPIKKEKDSWLCYVKGNSNGGSPLGHRDMIDSIAEVVTKK